MYWYTHIWSCCVICHRLFVTFASVLGISYHYIVLSCTLVAHGSMMYDLHDIYISVTLLMYGVTCGDMFSDRSMLLLLYLCIYIFVSVCLLVM